MTSLNGQVASEPSSASSPTNGLNTVWPTVLQTTLQELVSSVPAGSVPTIVNLLVFTKCIEQTSANVQGLGELATLLAIITQMAQKNNRHTFFKDLNRKLQSFTENLEAAWSQGKLNDFFNASHNTSSYIDLVQLIADSALVPAYEVLKSISNRGVEGPKLNDPSSSRAPIISGDVTGGVGGTGGTARIGGEGGGPQLDLDPNGRYRIDTVSGGTGGTGGVGIKVGGKGGTGKGPVISARRGGRS
ncbi:hypothetical protein B0H14DRAFT_3160093 [Mycena olivaceomarginata]|nr:hypothetical protein B0H14DRAFT_3160093 [Mycena olivaceomarginata]